MVSCELGIEIEKDNFVLSRARDKDELTSSWGTQVLLFLALFFNLLLLKYFYCVRS